jgi:hypothetical protein
MQPQASVCLQRMGNIRRHGPDAELKRVTIMDKAGHVLADPVSYFA